MTGFNSKRLMTDNLCKEILIQEFNRPVTKYKFSREWLKADYRHEDYDKVVIWCIEHFGPPDRKPDAWSRWRHAYFDQMWFRDQADYILFVLRWS